MGRKECKACGRFFEVEENDKDRLFCDACKDEEEENFKAVREYLFHNRGASAWDVAKHTGVSLRAIDRFLKEGRVEFITKE